MEKRMKFFGWQDQVKSYAVNKWMTDSGWQYYVADIP